MIQFPVERRRLGLRSVAAFTLIELLVVIAIIAVLASILVPTVGRSLERARQVYCSSNLRQIYIAGVSYAGDNKGTFPGREGRNVLGAAGESSRWLREGGEGSEWQNHGRLYADGYVSGGDVFYCPSQKLEPFRYATYQPWPTARQFGNSALGVRSAFHYNPMVVDHRRRNFERLYPNDVSLSDATTKTPFGVDLMQPGFVAHTQPKGFVGFNILYAGGGVALTAIPPNHKTLRYISQEQFYPALLALTE